MLTRLERVVLADNHDNPSLQICFQSDRVSTVYNIGVGLGLRRSYSLREFKDY